MTTNNKWKKEYDILLSLNNEVISKRKEVNELVKKLDILTEKLMDEVWKKYSNNVKWENNENYHISCNQCQEKMIETLKKEKKKLSKT